MSFILQNSMVQQSYVGFVAIKHQVFIMEYILVKVAR